MDNVQKKEIQRMKNKFNLKYNKIIKQYLKLKNYSRNRKKISNTL